MNDQQTSGLSSKVRDMWQRNQDLLRNAGSLAATTGMTSLFGFVFTIVAARMFTTNEVGWGNTAINEMQLFGTIGMFGLGTMLIGELPKRERDRGGLFAASVSTSLIGSALLGLIFAAIVGMYFSDARHLPGIGGTLGQLLLFVIGTSLTGATLVFDEGTIGMLRGGVQLWRNMAMSGIKLAALPLAAVLLHDKFGVGLSLAYVIGIVGSMIPAIIMLRRGGSRIFQRPDWQSLRRLLPVAVNHNWLNLAMATPSRIIPIIVTVVVGPTDSAVFYVAWMISSLLFMVPVHLGTVLFALASASPEHRRGEAPLRATGVADDRPPRDGGARHRRPLHARHLQARVRGVGHRAALAAHHRLHPADAAGAVHRGLPRDSGKVGKAAGLICFFALCEFTSIFLGGKFGGLNGLSFAYLGVLAMEGLITAPTVLRAAYAHTAAATGSFPAVSATGSMPRATGPLARVTGELIRLTGALPALPGAPDRQENGLAALFAIASAAVVSDGHTLNVATEIWRTGAFPVIPSDATESRSARQAAATSYDMFGGQPTVGRSALDQQVGTPEQHSYRHRQEAGLDALMAIATPVAPSDNLDEEPR